MHDDHEGETAVTESAAAAPETTAQTEAGPGRRDPLELKREDQWDPCGLYPMQLLALLVTDAELAWLSLEDAKRAVAWRESGIVLLPSVSDLASALETIRIQLEHDKSGSRFPLIWHLARALIYDDVYRWPLDFLDQVLAEVDTIERELESLSIGHAAVVAFGREGFPDVYSREATCFEEKYGHEERGRNLRTWFARPLDSIKAVCLHGKATGNAVALVRKGILVRFLWGAPVD
jgi:hypothetical protein